MIETLPDWLHDYRITHKMPLKDIAEATGVSVNTLSLFERKQINLGQDNLIKILRFKDKAA